MNQELAGKVVLLTGGTEGIGRAAALELARKGAKLTIVGRDAAKVTRVCSELSTASGNPAVDGITADLSLLAGMQAAAQEFKQRRTSLDVLVNNAGAVFQNYTVTSDGLEATFALNHMSYFVIARALVPLMSRGARIVSTSSGAHLRGHVDLAEIARRPSRKAGFGVYCDTKLCNVLHTSELARRIADRGIVVNCFHPGYVRTRFGRNQPGWIQWGIRLTAPLFARTPEQGADTLLWLASSPDAAAATGEYFFDRRPARRARAALDAELARGLWELSEQLCPQA
jgi:NAD(P)-dependent dehydrogenase (short-subunit alcohol dehydrogenase family)